MKKIILLLLLFPLILSAQTKGIFTDSRDNHNYKWVKIGEQIWMVDNLNYHTQDSHYYDNDSLKSNGRLYNWEDYMNDKTDSTGICPNGWHVPTLDNWNQLFNFVGRSTAADKLKSKLFKGGNDNYGFDALPNGRYIPNGKTISFENKDTHAYFGTSTVRDDNTMWVFFLYSEVSSPLKIDGDKKNGVSIRCIKNK